MKTAPSLATALLAAACFPLLAQQTGTTAPPPTENSTAPAAQTADLRPVSGELVGKLDSKTAKTGDSVVIKTRSTVKTADGTEIPKGSKVVGRVMAVKPSDQGNDNAQVSLQFDHIEIKNGQNLAIHSELEALSPSGVEDTASAGPATPSPDPSSLPSATSAGGSGIPGRPSGAATPAPSASSPDTPTQPGAPAPGTVVARTGNIAIRTTSIPGVLLARNEPGQQDPRMSQSSGILLGARRNIHLDDGTRVVIEVAAAGSAAGGGQ
ncbi:MAG TPA: hypothetical protein VE291_07040 [Terracidiphilus sp.]|jgi:hypothetical protein|nr:hypothetical protein [Terracidiphilus sp.]